MNSAPTKIQYILVITRNFSQPAPCESRGSNLNPIATLTSFARNDRKDNKLTTNELKSEN